MNNSFDIIDGQLYIDKALYYDGQSTNNHILALIGSYNQHPFNNSPDIRTGIESIIIDYRHSDVITIQRAPQDFVEELNSLYHNKLRGCIKINDCNHIYDLTVNSY